MLFTIELSCSHCLKSGVNQHYLYEHGKVLKEDDSKGLVDGDGSHPLGAEGPAYLGLGGPRCRIEKWAKAT